MRGLSEDIKNAIENALAGMTLSVEMLDVGDDKLSALVKSRLDSFSAVKEMLIMWQNSPSAPNHSTLKSYIVDLVSAGENSIEVLRKALKKEIDFDKLPKEKHGIAVASKPIILRAISEINSGNIELKNQIDADKFDLQDREFKRGYPEKFANQEFYPIKNYHKEWLDKETDSVMICPLGTKGEIINLDGLNIMLPKKPKRKDILFEKYSKDQQYWRRTEMPSGLTPDTQDAYTEFILQEFKRRREGVWFMNNGEAVYLTGSHYFALNWCILKDERFVGYMGYREAQKLMFYHTEACVLDQRCIGQFFVKSRRTGFTYEKLFRMLNEFTSTNKANFGLTSKSDEDAKKAFKKLSYAFLNLPFFFRPIVKGKEDSDVRIEFAKPSNNSNASKKNRDTSTKDYLNSTFDYEPTKEDAYDGQAMFRYLADEASKWKRGLNFLKHWGEVAPTMDEGGDIVGKAFVGSTVAAMKDGGEAFLSLHKQSLIRLRDKITERTPSGLYAYFLPAHKNMADYTDKYGVCHEVVESGDSFINTKGKIKTIGSVQFLNARRAAKKKEGDIDYNNELRAFPMTLKDAFRDEVTSTIFNLEKINDQLEYNEAYDVKNNLTRGNFSWENNIPDTRVIWTPTEKGRFLVAWIPPKEMQNKWIEKRNEFGFVCKHPLNDDLGAFGVDTYDQDSTQGSKLENTENGSEYNGGSKGAMLGLTGMTLKDAPNNSFFLEYVTRPQTAEIFFEDCLMACVFYGMPALIENNKIRFLLHFRNRGYRGFSINRFDKPMSKLSQTERDLGGIPSSGEEIITTHWTGIETYIDKYVGYYAQGQNTFAVREEGEMGSMPFERTLMDWSQFNVAKRTNFDATIASGYAIMAVNRKPYMAPSGPKKPVEIKFATYS
ncbi:MAG: hypothetical protein V4666_08235 [Bacteroidota bacterium]